MQDQNTAAVFTVGDPVRWIRRTGRRIDAWLLQIVGDTAEIRRRDDDAALWVGLNELEPVMAEPAVPLAEALRPAEDKRQARKLANEQAAGLRALADMLEANPHLAIQLGLTFRSLGQHVFPDNRPRELFAEFARAALAAGAVVTKRHHGDYGKVRASWGPVVVDLQADREQVCERVITGIEQVTKKIKDPVAVAALPDIEVSEDVPSYEWRCRPLLAAEPSTEDGV